MRSCGGLLPGMQASAGELTVQTEETTESEGTSQASEFSVTLQDIVDANNGIEKVLGSHARVGCTEIQYDENGNQTDTSQYAITRDGDSYVLSYVEKKWHSYLLELEVHGFGTQTESTKDRRLYSPLILKSMHRSWSG